MIWKSQCLKFTSANKDNNPVVRFYVITSSIKLHRFIEWPLQSSSWSIWLIPSSELVQARNPKKSPQLSMWTRWKQVLMSILFSNFKGHVVHFCPTSFHNPQHCEYQLWDVKSLVTKSSPTKCKHVELLHPIFKSPENTLDNEQVVRGFHPIQGCTTSNSYDYEWLT